VRKLVRERAGNCCEYCHIHQNDEPYFRFHIEHIVPRQHGGDGAESNLALACHHCNLHKGPNLTGIDPETGTIVELFHPRVHFWDERLIIRGVNVIGITSKGRATVRVLAMNATSRLQLRGVAAHHD
jgi:HNH endonuclease